MPDLQARLSKKRDRDIIEAFKNVSNHSTRLRELVRLGLMYEAQQRLEHQRIPIQKTKQDVAPSRPKRTLPKKNKETIVDNILAGFE